MRQGERGQAERRAVRGGAAGACGGWGFAYAKSKAAFSRSAAAAVLLVQRLWLHRTPTSSILLCPLPLLPGTTATSTSCSASCAAAAVSSSGRMWAQ